MQGPHIAPNVSRRQLAILGLTFAYLIVSSAGAGLSIGRGLPAEWLGLLKSDNEIWVEFMVGGGTALSTNFWILVLMAAAATASLRAGRVGRVALLLLFGLSAFNVIGALGEPVLWRSITPQTFDPLYLSLGLLLVAVPGALAVVAFNEFSARRAQGARAGAV